MMYIDVNIAAHYLCGLQRGGAGHSEAAEQPQLPPRLGHQEQHGGGVRVPEGQLPVLLPPGVELSTRFREKTLREPFIFLVIYVRL